MFLRIALVIVGLFVALFLVVAVRVIVHRERVIALISCNRGIASPYRILLTRMRKLADAGETEQLRDLIKRAQERSEELSEACMEQSEDGIYAKQVRELIQ